MKRMRRILLSLVVITVAATAVVAGTRAFFSDTETSTGNIFAAGTIDLKIDHSRQTYNGYDCYTCGVEIKSDATNMVISKDGVSLEEPYGAILVKDKAGDWANIPEADWIWGVEGRPESGDRTTYTFEKKFEWYGPQEYAILEMEISADDDYVVKVNGNEIASDNAAWDYTTPYPSIDISSYIIEGENSITFQVTNSGGWYAGLIYKLTIGGDCEDNYFTDLKATCELWGFKELEDEKFFNFNDVKPGDYGTNKISYHVHDNDAYLCMMVDNVEGELNDAIQFTVWDGETRLFGSAGPETFSSDGETITIADGEFGEPVEANKNNYLDIHWCMGNMVDSSGGITDCDGSGDHNDYMGDQMEADLIFYTEQWRNNEDFRCVGLDVE